ncbi:MAG: HypC/HybG/HupF family hydrogenase formation chaperone [Thermoprotei archaeon]|nr:MAG: HypC/HybG/HupF family hydrogenase formation chaperone [Thermoprotei archaeon]
MCLGIPGKVLEVRGDTAIVDFGGLRKEVSIVLTPDVQPGDYVIVHAGFAISKISREEALEMLKLLSEVVNSIKVPKTSSR